ncbi:peptide ABC transporter substrate-binding protein [Planobispora rosea]|uniref:Peptide ABC transporter substrate-binding protein n=1 Tax=Planobispora rosea TaxID=35762 RepID=A0A8J3S5L1_PLARO|nr:ABC transporter substrate-binding protein [Planobispora rosea]GGS93114.1 peptide ABC transporter substrate-binding protein [Planobispora rosea]GIH87180.1 peptide ABC transporter substrate-binding protein [Planobispora rosea]
MKKSARVAIAALAFLAAPLALAGCSDAGGGTPENEPKALSLATMTLPQSLDPKDATGSALPFFQAVYDTLIKREPDGSYSPMLATEWKYNDDLTELALTLRGGVKFDDGTPFDAEAVKANMERFRKGGGAQAKTLNDVKTIKVVDATHVTLELSKPNPAMLFYLSDAAGLMANPADFAKGDALKTKPSGTGPYDLDQNLTFIGTRWTFTRAPGYWGTRLPYDTITINFFDNETAIVNGLKTGQVNAALIQDADQQISAESDPKIKAVKQEFDFQGLVLFDRGGVVTPQMRDPRVRQALNYAIDRKTMLEKIRQSRGELTNQVFGKSTAAYKPELDSYYSYDPVKARELLKEAGHADGFTLKLPRIAAIVSDALAASLQADLGAVGVKLVWEDVDAGSAIKRIFTDRAFSGLVMNIGQSSTDWVVVGELVLPGAFNMFGYTDDTVKKLLPEIQGRDAEEAKAELQALNEHLVKDGWFVPFYRMTYLHVSDGSVTITPQDGMAVPSIYNYAPAE